MPGAVEHGAHARQFSKLQRGRVRQVGCCGVVEFDDLRKIDRLVDFLVLAKAMIGCVEVGKIDAVEGFGIGAESRRILERRRDKLVEVDRLISKARRM
jgi:hypothetical protein